MNDESREGRRGHRGHPGEGRGHSGRDRGERGERRERGERGRRRRGDIRPLLLAGLLDGPAHGYELMRRLEERSGGEWRPSAGSVYPTLQQLEDEGLVQGRDEDGRKVYDLTDQGRAEADADTDALRRLAGDRDDAGPRPDLRAELHQLHLAARQVAVAGDEEQVTEAVALVRRARQDLYRLLAGE